MLKWSVFTIFTRLYSPLLCINNTLIDHHKNSGKKYATIISNEGHSHWCFTLITITALFERNWFINIHVFATILWDCLSWLILWQSHHTKKQTNKIKKRASTNPTVSTPHYIRYEPTEHLAKMIEEVLAFLWPFEWRSMSQKLVRYFRIQYNPTLYQVWEKSANKVICIWTQTSVTCIFNKKSKCLNNLYSPYLQDFSTIISKSYIMRVSNQNGISLRWYMWCAPRKGIQSVSLTFWGFGRNEN